MARKEKLEKKRKKNKPRRRIKYYCWRNKETVSPVPVESSPGSDLP